MGISLVGRQRPAYHQEYCSDILGGCVASVLLLADLMAFKLFHECCGTQTCYFKAVHKACCTAAIALTSADDPVRKATAAAFLVCFLCLISSRIVPIVLSKPKQVGCDPADHKKLGGACAATCIEVVPNVVRVIQGGLHSLCTPLLLLNHF
jgi:hypothetical protein